MALNIIQGVIPNIIAWLLGITFALLSVYIGVTTLNYRNSVIFAILSAMIFAFLLIDAVIYYITSNINIMIILIFIAVIVLIVLNSKTKRAKRK